MLWQHPTLGKILVVNKPMIDINRNLTIVEIGTSEAVENIDLRDFLFEVLPHKEDGINV